MNAQDIKKRLNQEFSYYDYKLFNTYIFGWESDFFSISKSGYSIEVEIKISKYDFYNDYKKTTSSGKNKHDFMIDTNNNKPNKFYFACPENLITTNEINDKYGLIYIYRYKFNGGETIRHKVIQQAKFLHKDKILENPKYLKILLNKFYFRSMKLRERMDLLDEEVFYGQCRFNQLDKYFI